MADDKKIQVELTAIDKNLQSVFRSAEASMAAFAATGSKLEGAFGGIGKAFAGITAALAGGKIFGDIVKTTKDVASEVKTLKESFGISAEAASVLRVALDDNFISSDQVIGASARLTKQIVSNGDAFRRLGIDVNDASGKARPIIEVMIDANSKIKQFSEGFSQNAAATELYGKGWESLRDILKLTSDEMTKAQSRAEELGVVFDGDKLAKIKAYKSAMKDLGDVSEAISVNIGMQLVPALTLFAEHASKGGLTMSQSFAQGMRDGIEMVQKLTVSLAAGMDKIALYSQMKIRIDLSGVSVVGKKELKEKLAAIDEAAMEQWNEIEGGFTKRILPDGRKIKVGKSYTPKPKETNPGAANDKETAYLQAKAEKELAILKAASDMRLVINQREYNEGRRGLIEYLDEEAAIRKAASDNEIATRERELAIARDKLAALAPVIGKDGEERADKMAANRNEALKKIEVAEKALVESQSKGAIQVIEAEQKKTLAIIDSTMATTSAALAVAELNGEWEKSRQLQIDINNLKIQRANASAQGKEEIALIQAQNAELERGKTALGAYGKGFGDLAQTWANHAKNMEEVGRQTAQAMQSSFSDYFFDAMQGKLKSLNDYLTSFLNSMQREIANMMSKELVGGIKSGDGLLGAASSLIGGWMKSANGNVLAGGSISSLSGGVYDKPMAFTFNNKFAKGGILGEAGPEAVMPLTRMGNGKLGVQASGSGSGVVVNIIESPGNGGKQQQRTGDNGVSIIDVMVEQIKGSIAGDISRGSGTVPAALQSTYGLNRSIGGY